jgi:uncharacterized RDD family membrane protein YckC
MEHDPHQPVAPDTAADDERPCGLVRRGLAMLYDSLIVLALLIIAGSVALPLTGDRVQAGRDPFFTLYLAGVWFFYLGWCWIHGGQTMGMRAWRVHLRAETTVGWRASALRFGVSLLSAACLGLGFWLSLLRPDRACWHDRASGTRLVHRPKADRRRRAAKPSD